MIIVRAPVRISFGGGGTDLAAYYNQYDGFVVNAAITRYCYVVARPTLDGSVRISSADYHTWLVSPPAEIPPVQAPLALPAAAVAWFRECGLLTGGIDLFLACEVAPGTGLGSSSAMAVALVRAIAEFCGAALSSQQVAEVACTLEIERLGMPIGKQDQYASACGGINALTFSRSGVDVEPLTLSEHVMRSLSANLLLFSTGQQRNSADILSRQQADTERKPATIESLHRLKSLAIQMREALQVADLDRFGQLLDRGWQEKKRLAQKISSDAIDRWYEVARRSGALGGKITGAGGGGFLLLYCPADHQQALRAALAPFGLRELPFDFDHTGAQVPARQEGDELLRKGRSSSASTLLAGA
ncbi:MAG: GHMP kinase [Ktedonobacteraceae bacterium]|nr:GHMP kinase [Ktedonobacteraceae bacterium]